MKLKPCPFCGCEVAVKKDDQGMWYAECAGCFTTTLYAMKRSDVVKIWNKRVSDDPTNEMLLTLNERWGCVVLSSGSRFWRCADSTDEGLGPDLYEYFGDTPEAAVLKAYRGLPVGMRD